MPTYEHWQDIKNAEKLPEADSIGACLTCKYWKTDAPRHVSEVSRLALCEQPELIPVALIVSGSSACNKWEKHPDAGEEAQNYSLRGQPA